MTKPGTTRWNQSPSKNGLRGAGPSVPSASPTKLVTARGAFAYSSTQVMAPLGVEISAYIPSGRRPSRADAARGPRRSRAAARNRPASAVRSGNLQAAPHREALLVLQDVAVRLEDVLPAAGRPVILPRDLRQGVALDDHVRPGRGGGRWRRRLRRRGAGCGA